MVAWWAVVGFSLICQCVDLHPGSEGWMCSIKGAIERVIGRWYAAHVPCACVCGACWASLYQYTVWMLMNQADSLGQWVLGSLINLIWRPCPHRLALKLCLRKATCLEVLHCDFGFRFPWGAGDQGCTVPLGCACFRGAGSELGERLERPRGKRLWRFQIWM